MRAPDLVVVVPAVSEAETALVLSQAHKVELAVHSRVASRTDVDILKEHQGRSTVVESEPIHALK